MDGNFRECQINHENNENLHPMKITRHTAYGFSGHFFLLSVSAPLKRIIKVHHASMLASSRLHQDTQDTEPRQNVAILH